MKRSTRKDSNKMNYSTLGIIIIVIATVLLYGIWVFFIAPKD
jgi:hypothetical protein